MRYVDKQNNNENQIKKVYTFKQESLVQDYHYASKKLV